MAHNGIRIFFTANNGGSDITGYKLDYSIDNVEMPSKNLKINSITLYIPNKPKAVVKFSLYAQNKWGESSPITFIKQLPEWDGTPVPEKALSLKRTDTGSDSITIGWKSKNLDSYVL